MLKVGVIVTLKTGGFMNLLKSSLLFLLASATFSSSVATAYLVPGDRRPNPPRYPEYPDRPGRPDRPGHPSDIVRSISIYRTISNEKLALRQLLDLDRDYRGLRIESVTVTADSSYANAELQLLINGRVEDYQRANSNYIVLQPRVNDEIGSEIRTLQLDVRGSLYIRTIEVRLSDRGGYYPEPGLPARQNISVSVFQTIYSGNSVNLSRLIDARRLDGYKIEGMTIYGNARYRSGLVDVVQNGRRVASSVNLEQYSSAHRVYLFEQVEISPYSSLDLVARGDIEIDRVELQLIRARR